MLTFKAALEKGQQTQGDKARFGLKPNKDLKGNARNNGSCNQASLSLQMLSKKVTKCTKGMKKYPDVRKLKIGMENDGLATPRDGFF